MGQPVKKASARPARNKTRSVPALNKSYRVVSVTDGDTVKIKVNGNVEPVRLLGIDAPETGQGFDGARSRAWMAKAVLGRRVKLKNVGRCKYGRILADIYVDGWLSDRWANYGLVEAGFAFPSRTGKVHPAIYQAFKKAKESNRGIFGRWFGLLSRNPVHPAVWRKRNKGKRK